MKDFEALKVIWHNQVTLPKVSHEDIFHKIRKTKSGLSSKLLIEIIVNSLALGVICYVWMASPFKMWTSHLAMLIIAACCIYYIISQINNYCTISYDKLTEMPEKYISYLKKYKQERYIFNTRKFTIYAIMVSLGFLLYFIEIYYISPFWTSLMALIFSIGWIAFCYFYLMRIYIKKEESKLEYMIQNLERIQKQFSHIEE